jgi:hypothetical protein
VQIYSNEKFLFFLFPFFISLRRSRIRLIDGRPYSPTASPEIDLLGGMMRPGPAAHSFMIGGGGGGTPITTPMGTPAGTPRGGTHSRDSRDLLACDSPDTLSETDSQASLRLRRKLPLLPPDQEAALLPSVQKKKLELAKSQQQQQQQQQQQLVSVQERIKAYSNLRQGSLTEANTSSGGVDRGYSSGASAASFSGLTRPTSETNLRQLAYGESMASSLAARPGSAHGLLQGSSIVNANGLRSSINSNLTSGNLAGGGVGIARSNPSISVKSEDQTLRESLAAILPPDLRHLVGAPSTNLVMTTSSTTNDSSTILSVVSLDTRNGQTFTKPEVYSNFISVGYLAGRNSDGCARRLARITVDTSPSLGGGAAETNGGSGSTQEPNGQGPRTGAEDPPRAGKVCRTQRPDEKVKIQLQISVNFHF